MSAKIYYNPRNTITQPAIKYDPASNEAIIFIPQINTTDPGKGEFRDIVSTAFFSVTKVDVLSGDVIATDNVDVVKNLFIDSHSGVYVDELGVYLSRAVVKDNAVLKAYDVNKMELIEFDNSEQSRELLVKYALLFDQHLSQKYGEYSENLGFIHTPRFGKREDPEYRPSTLQINWLHSDGVSEILEDRANIRSYLDSIVDANKGLIVEYIGTFSGHSVFWQTNMGALLYVSRDKKTGKKTLNRFNTAFQKAMVFGEGIRFSSYNEKTGKFKMAGVKWAAIRALVEKGCPKKIEKSLKKVRQSTRDYEGVSCINSKEVQFITEFNDDETLVNASTFKMDELALDVMHTLPKNSIEDNYIMVKDNNGHYHRIVFKISEGL